MYKTILQTILLCFVVNCEQLTNYDVIKKYLNQCSRQEEMIKCIKIQAVKIADRALRSKRLDVIDGVSITSRERQSKQFENGTNLNESKLQALNSEELDAFLTDTSSRFLQTHKLELNIPKLVQEARGKKNRGGNGALYWALAIKGSFLAMAYQGIAAMAGLALIMGKMALLLSAILGLKKLVSSGHETTTFEIVKQPKYSEQHTHSTSYEDDHRKSFHYDDLHPSKRIYRAYI